MSRSVDETKKNRFGTGSRAHKQVQDKANTKRRQRDRVDRNHSSTND